MYPDNNAAERALRGPVVGLPWCINTGKSLIPLTLLFFAQKRNLLIPLELSRVMHQGIEIVGFGAHRFGVGHELPDALVAVAPLLVIGIAPGF